MYSYANYILMRDLWMYFQYNMQFNMDSAIDIDVNERNTIHSRVRSSIVPSTSSIAAYKVMSIKNWGRNIPPWWIIYL